MVNQVLTPMKFVTITANPSYDDSYQIPRLSADDVVRASVCETRPGGKGINVSRVLHALKKPTLALALAGRDNAALFEQALRKEGLPLELLYTGGQIRRNLNLLLENGTSYKINAAGPVVDAAARTALNERLASVLDAGDCCVFSGSLPRGMEKKDLFPLAGTAAKNGARLVLDVDFLTLEDLTSLRPWLIKPNLHELLRLCDGQPGNPLAGLPQNGDGAANQSGLPERARQAAAWLRNRTGTEQVLLTLGETGAVLAAEGEPLYLPAPKLKAVTTVGAGDTALAAFLAAKNDGFSDKECLRSAIELSAAVCRGDGPLGG